MTVFDLRAHRPIASLPTAPGLDVIKYDAGLRRVYVACGSGAISIFEVDAAGQPRKLEDFPVQKRVHSLAVDPKTHRVYAPEQEHDGAPVARMIVYEAVGRADRLPRVDRRCRPPAGGFRAARRGPDTRLAGITGRAAAAARISPGRRARRAGVEHGACDRQSDHERAAEGQRAERTDADQRSRGRARDRDRHSLRGSGSVGNRQLHEAA